MNFFNDIAEILGKYGNDLLRGMGYTLFISIVSTVLGLLIGLIVGIIRTIPQSDNKVVRVFQKFINFLLAAYIEIFRGTPMMVQSMVIFWGYCAFNPAGALETSVINIFAIIIVTINTGAYIAEIVRGGIIGVDKGQFEGAHAIGLGHFKTMIYVVIPQVMRTILPSVANEFVINIKDTSVLNVIGFTELYFVTKIVVKETFLTFETYTVCAVMYFIMTFTITRLLKLFEKLLAGKKNYSVIQDDSKAGAETSVTEG